MNKILFTLLSGFAFIITSCSNVEYNHPLDSKGTNMVSGDKIADDDGDGIANLWDPDHPLFKSNKDTIPPVITILGDNPARILVKDPENKLSTYGRNSIQITDNRDESFPEANIDIRLPVTSLQVKTDSIVYTVSDAAGNKASATRKIEFYEVKIDTTKPDIFFQDEVIVGKGETFDPLKNVSAFDNVDQTITSKITYTGTVNTNVAGTYTLTYTVKDNAGNTTTKPRKVIVQEGIAVDKDFPVITLKGKVNDTIAEGVEYKDPGCTATDTTDGDITAKVTVTIKKDGSTVTIPAKPAAGFYTFYYTVIDKANNSTTVTRTLKVKSGGGGEDTDPPIITLVNPKDSVTTITIGSVWKKPALTVVDAVDKSLKADSVKVETATAPNTAKAATYSVKLYISDASGNMGTLYIKVIVADKPTDASKPVITITGKNPDTIGTNAVYTDKGATATDSADGNLTTKIVVDPTTLDTKTAGTFKITYTVSDKAGNITKAERTVVIVDGLVVPLLEKYKVPTTTPLQTLSSKIYTTNQTEGTGAPTLTSIKTFKISWDLVNAGLYEFAFEYNGSPYHKAFNSSMTFNFKDANPKFKITGTEVTGLDGEYYITIDSTNLVWVKTDGSFAIIWKP